MGVRLSAGLPAAGRAAAAGIAAGPTRDGRQGIYVTGEEAVAVYDGTGRLLRRIHTGAPARAAAVDDVLLTLARTSALMRCAVL